MDSSLEINNKVLLSKEYVEQNSIIFEKVLSELESITKVAKDTIKNFENIKYNMVSSYNFSDYQNIIGFDWKEFDGSNYSITPNLTFIIETSSNRYFKLRFTDFYNSSGVKGYPTFEIQEL